MALPHLQETRSALRSALLLSIPWALWHLPLFAFAEGLQELGLAGLPFWYGSVLVGSVLATWLFNSRGGSIAVVAVDGESLSRRDKVTWSQVLRSGAVGRAARG